MKSLSAKSIATLCLIVAAPAVAQDYEVPQGWTVGGFAVASQSPYVGEGNTFAAFPIVRYTGDGYSIGFEETAVDVYSTKRTSVAAILQLRTSDLSDTDAAELTGIDRQATGDLGVKYQHNLGPFFAVAGHMVGEVTGEHGGQEVAAYAEQRLPLVPLPLAVRGGARWQSADLSQYVYGVLDSDTGFEAYAPGAATLPYLSLGARLPISDKATFVSRIRLDALPKAVQDSPIVAEKTALSVGVGVLYSF